MAFSSRCLMSVFVTAWLATSTVLLGSSPVSAQTFSDTDLSTIVSASRNNEMRFQRDYRGKNFSSWATFSSATETMFIQGRFMVSVSTQFGSVTCFTEDRGLLNRLVNWNRGQPVVITGMIKDTTLGSLILDTGCTMRER